MSPAARAAHTMTVMADTRDKTPAPAGRTPAAGGAPAVSRLVSVVAFTLLVTAAALAAVIVLANRPQWWRALLAATVVSTLASAASIPPVAWGLRHAARRPELAAAGYFMSAAARLVLSVGGCLLAVRLGGYPKA